MFVNIMGHRSKPSASAYWHSRRTNHQYHEHHAARPLDSHPGRVPDDQVGDSSGEDDVHDMGSSYGAARPCHPCYTVLDGQATEARMAASQSSASSGFGTRTKNPAVTLKPPGLKGCAVG